ncbi:MAG: MFS transporter [Chloroflexi bacterium]|nr:MFS transporter [Chloroflexota bacterium]
MQTKWLVLLAVGVGTLMSAMSTNVVNVVLPVVTREFGAEVATIEWVITVYLLVVSGLLLSFGRLGDLRGHKPVYVAGFFVFMIASPLCALAPNAVALIAFRGVQALGAAMLFSNSPAILTRNFPAEQRGQALGLQSMMTYLGLTLGPSFGGWLTSQFDWRAAFYINIPFGLLGLVLSIYFIPHDPPEKNTERFDAIGALTFMIALVALLLGLNQGHAWGWTSAPVLGLIALAILFAVIFVRAEKRDASPMLDLTLFRQRLFSAAVASAVLNYICVYSVLFLTPFYLIQGRGMSPAEAGLMLTAQPLVMAITAPLSGTVSDRIGSRALATLGMIVLAGGLFFLAQLAPDSTQNQVALGLAMVGLGTGIFTTPNTNALMGSAPRHRQGVAAGVMATACNTGMALGVGLAGAIFSTVQSSGGSLFDAISAGFFAAGLAGILGAITSAVRGSGASAQ